MSKLETKNLQKFSKGYNSANMAAPHHGLTINGVSA